MLKEVGASGQISLGKRFAGQLFEVVFQVDGRVEMLPMLAVSARRPPAAETGQVHGSEAWVPAGGYKECNAWALENRLALDAYAHRIESRGTAANELQAFLAELAANPDT